jgi:hypothetical protein
VSNKSRSSGPMHRFSTPSGELPDLPEECRQIGRDYFARSPGSDLWIWFGDLPEATRNALWEKRESKLAWDFSDARYTDKCLLAPFQDQSLAARPPRLGGR